MSPRLAPRRLVGLVAALATGASLVVVAAAPVAAADPCATGGNPIVCENSKSGTDPDEWDIDGAGDEGLQGFSTDISVNVGSTVQFKIKTDAVNYHIDIYRTGWYGGDGARFITSVPSPSVRQNQPECVSDDDTGNYDCGKWAVSASWAVPTTAVSGVYLAKLTDPVTDDTSHITFVVRNDASTSAVVFQTSDTTWHAYNTYGGSSFYQGGAVGRAYKISYNRPFATRNWEDGRDFYFSSEYAMVRFLERNGYDVSYMAGVDADRRGSLIKNHKVFMSVGHDEYWSGAQRANIEAARDAGVNLAFFSGNEAYWRTRYENSIAGPSTPYRTITSYKETWSNQKVDTSSPEWTGTWRDPRFSSPADGGGKPENALTGTMYTSNFSDLPVTVSSDEGKYRLWRNTSLTSLSSGTKVALAPHTIGYESNEDVDNGSRPQGLVRLSTTTGLVPQYLQDFGNVVAEGTTTHHLTLYRAPSGALVFSAGSIQWAWGLDQEHDGNGAPADQRMQQATVNLLADMKVQPGSLMAGLSAATASTDATGPVATISSPAAGAAIANGTTVTVTGVATDVGGRVAGVEVSTDAGASWHPATGTTAWSYTYVQSGLGSAPVRVRAVDDSANIGAVATRSFTVACPCSIFGSSIPKVPAANDADPVELGLRFSSTSNGFITGVRFYKGAGNTGVHTGALWSAAGVRLATATFQNESAAGWQTATLSPAVEVTAGTTYVASYTAPAGHYAVQDDAFWYRGVSAPPLQVAGGFGASGSGTFGAPGTFPAESFRSTHYFVDVVYSSVDTTPLTISGQAPAGGSTSVPVGSAVSVALSKAVTAGSVAITLTAQGGATVAGTTGYDAATRKATFTPAAALAPSTSYTASVSASANGAGITGATSWSFTTAAPAQVLGARTVSLYDDSAVPTTLQDPDTDAVTLGTRFASSVDGTVTGVRFYKGPNNTGTHVGQLWAIGGTAPLAQATFGTETTSGWQTVTFATPVRITKDTEYVVAYRAPAGRYSSTAGAFSGTGVQRAPLRTESMSGAYTYGTGFPGSRSSTSYLVDVVFTQDAAALAVSAQSPASADPGASVSAPVTVTFNAPLVAGASLSLATGGANVGGTATRSSDGRTLVFTPSTALAQSTTYTATASGLSSTDGSALAAVVWSFTTAGPDNCPCTLFSGLTPASPSVNDSSAVELGASFSPTVWGLVTGVRFYKGAGNTGTHTGTLWSSTGEQLRTVTFADETATGWQTAMFSSPYQVAPGTSYVISYHAPQGHYAATANDFAVNRTVGPLTTPAVGNGRYRYGAGGVVPSETWQQTNYFVDVVFSTATPDLPTVSAQAPPAGATGVSTTATVAATLSVGPTSGSPALALSGPFGSIEGTSAYDPATRRVTFTPASALPGGSSIAVTTSLAGTPLLGGAWTFTTAAATGASVSLWTDAEVPTVAAWNDPDPVMVGTRFTASVPGAVTAIRFYKGATNTGTHTVSLWDASGVKVAEALSSSESASGWQTIPLATPAVLLPGQVYTAAYHSTSGRYAVTSNGLSEVRTVGPLSTVATGGAYVYGTTFPASSTTTFFGVDLVFAPAG